MAGLPDATFSRLLAIVKGADAVRIPIGNDRFALIDAADEETVREYGWTSSAPGYAVAQQTKPLVIMHRLIMSAPQGTEIDHIDGDRFNNQRHNLRLCTRSENAKNRHSASGASRFKGVWRDRYSWRATIWADNKRSHLGSFTTERKAAMAYDKAALELHGEFACTNRDLKLY